MSSELPEICATCVHWYWLGYDAHQKYRHGGWCRRYPKPVFKAYYGFCGEHKYFAAMDEIKQTPLEVVPIAAKARRVCKNCGLKTLGDVLLVGRSGIRHADRPCTVSIGELERVFRGLGVHW